VEGLLLGNDGQMGGVDEWDDQRHIGISAIVLGVGEHGELSSSEGLLYR